mmetsp:Transcript_9714/g.27225  ORF Transcript_9714/g.27225 Transcript_9714/m.27225 type:complete len:213 (+) Transcript_9714:628-1266(+)
MSIFLIVPHNSLAIVATLGFQCGGGFGVDPAKQRRRINTRHIFFPRITAKFRPKFLLLGRALLPHQFGVLLPRHEHGRLIALHCRTLLWPFLVFLLNHIPKITRMRVERFLLGQGQKVVKQMVVLLRQAPGVELRYLVVVRRPHDGRCRQSILHLLLAHAFVLPPSYLLAFLAAVPRRVALDAFVRTGPHATSVARTLEGDGVVECHVCPPL